MRYRVTMETGDPGGSGLTETRDFDTFSAADRWREDWILGGWVMTGWEEIARLVHMNVEWVGSDWRGFRVSSMQDAMTQLTGLALTPGRRITRVEFTYEDELDPGMDTGFTAHKA